MKTLIKVALLFITTFLILSQITAIAAPADNMSTSQIKSALEGKTKAEVKAFFGRPPDKASGDIMWTYMGQFRDLDAEKTFAQCSMDFNGSVVSSVVFLGSR